MLLRTHDAPGCSGDARELASLARRMIDRKTGLVAQLRVGTRTSDQVRLSHLYSTMSDIGRLPSGGAIQSPCGGQYTLREALRQVLFEVAERSSAAFVDHRKLVRARPVGPAFLHGDRLPLYAGVQYDSPGFPFRRLTEASEIYWAESRSLVHGAKAFVPAALVHIPYEPTSEAEWLGPSTSTGMACDRSWTRACLAGLLEVCERDAFTITWMNRLSLPRLRVDPGSPFDKELAGAIGRRARVDFVTITNDLRVPTVLAVLETSVFGRRVVTFGSAARPRYVEAARKAFTEAAGDLARLRARAALTRELWEPAEDFSNVTDWEWHSLVYLHERHQPALDFLTASPVEEPLEGPHDDERDEHADPARLLEDYLARVAGRSDVFCVPLTALDVADLGLHVIKIVAPHLVPLNPDHRYPWLGHARLYTVPRIMGLAERDSRPEDLNPYPHPFA